MRSMPGIEDDTKIIREPELGRLLKHLERSPERYLMVYLASEAGLRLTEACCMRVEDFSGYEDRRIMIRVAKKQLPKPPARMVRVKAAKETYRSAWDERILWAHFISDRTVAVLKKYFRWKKLDPRKHTGWLFPGRAPAGHALEREVHNWFTKATKKAGIGRKTFHCLRHYRGFTVQRLKGDITITKDELRHSSVEITQMYVRRTADERKQLANELDGGKRR